MDKLVQLATENQTLAFGIVAGVTLVGAYIIYNKLKEVEKGLTEEYREFPLVEKTEVTHNTRIFRFALPSPNAILGLPVGKHMILKFTTQAGDDVMRPYTPTTSDDEKGYFDLCIKVYPDGKMSSHLDTLRIGDTILAKGPRGMIHYDTPGHFTITSYKGSREINSPRISMIAGGTGITPMLQIIRQIVKDPNDNTQVRMIFGNISEDDILLREELEEVHRNNENITVYFTLDRPPAGWTQGSGYVTSDMVAANLFPPANDSTMLLCGPTPMVKILFGKVLPGMGYDEKMMLKF